MINNEYKYSDITARIIGCAMTVHSELGMGFPEYIYQRAMEYEMQNQKIGFVREYEMSIYFKDALMGKRRVDFFVENCISVELKATSALTNEHFNQALNYLKAGRTEVGLLINFGSPSLQFKRLINNNYR
jgi:GxxExxY protein